MRDWLYRKTLYLRLSVALRALRFAQLIAPRNTIHGAVIREGVGVVALAFATSLEE